MSLRWRVALALAAVAGAACALAAVGAYVATARGLEAAVDDTLRLRVDDAGRPGALGPPGRRQAVPGPAPVPRGGAPGPGVGGAEGVEGACPADALLRPVPVAQLVSPGGEVTSCLPDGTVLPVDRADLDVGGRPGASRLSTVVAGGTAYRVLTVPWGEGSVLQVARDLDEVGAVLAGLRWRLGGIVALAAGAAAGAGWLVARRVVRPVERLRDAAEAIATTQDLATPVPAGGPGEIGSLATSFTTMVGALDVSRRQQERLVADASHEVRTPLTSLRTNLELLERFEELDPADRRATLAAAEADLAELTHLLTEVVELASDPARTGEAPEPATLGELAAAVAARARRRSGRAVALVAPTGPGPELVVRPQAVERAIANLVDNALKHSPDGAPVEVVVEGRRLEVRDRGPGIAEADLPRVFDRFFRAESARDRPGSGLGLAIVAQVVASHGGVVHAAARPGGGAVVGFELPADLLAPAGGAA